MTDQRREPRPPHRAAIIAMRLLALAGAGVSAYLLVVSISTIGVPLGCGAGSGCAEVLTSRWAGAFGVPVSGPALLIWLAALAASVRLNRAGDAAGPWHVLVVLAACIALAAAWFIVIQALVIRAWCPWCLADHAIGLVFAALVMTRAPPDARRLGPALAIAALGLAALVGGGFLVEYSPASLRRLPAGENADSGPGPRRVLQLLDGDLVLRPHEEPLVGSPDADHLVVAMVDYCCPHCRATHGYLMEALALHPERLAVLILPMPRDADCNPDIAETEPRFESACELAALALAVRRADGAAFETFDRWLFETEDPRPLEAATARARDLVGAAALERWRDDESIAADLRRNIDAYRALGAERIPVLLAVGLAPIEGRPESAEELRRVLMRELGLN